FAVVDSPRWPRDRRLGSVRARAILRGRDLDLALRRFVTALAAHWPALGRLSMYPTPPAAYFAACVGDPRCKPHLRALGQALFAARPRREQRRAVTSAAPRGGMLFTRFMLAGFAAYRVLEAAGVEVCESFPDLQFRLSAPRCSLLAKRAGNPALAMRQRIVAQLAQAASIATAAPPTLDFADAAVLALGARLASDSGILVELRSD